MKEIIYYLKTLYMALKGSISIKDFDELQKKLLFIQKAIYDDQYVLRKIPEARSIVDRHALFLKPDIKDTDYLTSRQFAVKYRNEILENSFYQQPVKTEERSFKKKHNFKKRTSGSPHF